MVDRTASYKTLVVLAPVMSAVGYLMIILLWRGHTSIWESLYTAPCGFGTGLLFSSVFVGLAAAVKESQMAMATSVFYLSSNLGAIIGASLVSSVLEVSLRNQLTKSLRGIPDRGKVHTSLKFCFRSLFSSKESSKLILPVLDSRPSVV